MSPDERFDLIDSAFCAIADKAQAEGVTNLSPAEKIVYFAWSALGLIGNGSFQYLFENEVDPHDVAQAFGELELFNSSRLFLLARDVLPHNFFELSWPEQLAILEKHEERVDNLAKEILAASDEIEEKLSQHILGSPSLALLLVRKR